MVRFCCHCLIAVACVVANVSCVHCSSSRDEPSNFCNSMYHFKVPQKLVCFVHSLTKD
ncbi:hypothetical protein PVAP13_7NG443266 [Panicum virgatum]|uniref:Secreted protein n=1 Tax=Panicum virgatum TaxID=38727 RepID=A0A8T0QGI6_PANVG|nr:hypothetical protein PVAP13_7NG443266 [Panicum virgatum]